MSVYLILVVNMHTPFQNHNPFSCLPICDESRPFLTPEQCIDTCAEPVKGFCRELVEQISNSEQTALNGFLTLTHITNVALSATMMELIGNLIVVSQYKGDCIREILIHEITTKPGSACASLTVSEGPSVDIDTKRYKPINYFTSVIADLRALLQCYGEGEASLVFQMLLQQGLLDITRQIFMDVISLVTGNPSMHFKGVFGAGCAEHTPMERISAQTVLFGYGDRKPSESLHFLVNIARHIESNDGVLPMVVMPESVLLRMSQINGSYVTEVAESPFVLNQGMTMKPKSYLLGGCVVALGIPDRKTTGDCGYDNRESDFLHQHMMMPLHLVGSDFTQNTIADGIGIRCSLDKLNVVQYMSSMGDMYYAIDDNTIKMPLLSAAYACSIGDEVIETEEYRLIYKNVGIDDNSIFNYRFNMIDDKMVPVFYLGMMSMKNYSNDRHELVTSTVATGVLRFAAFKDESVRVKEFLTEINTFTLGENGSVDLNEQMVTDGTTSRFYRLGKASDGATMGIALTTHPYSPTMEWKTRLEDLTRYNSGNIFNKYYKKYFRKETNGDISLFELLVMGGNVFSNNGETKFYMIPPKVTRAENSVKVEGLVKDRDDKQTFIGLIEVYNDTKSVDEYLKYVEKLWAMVKSHNEDTKFLTGVLKERIQAIRNKETTLLRFVISVHALFNSIQIYDEEGICYDPVKEAVSNNVMLWVQPYLTLPAIKYLTSGVFVGVPHGLGVFVSNKLSSQAVELGKEPQIRVNIQVTATPYLQNSRGTTYFPGFNKIRAICGNGLQPITHVNDLSGSVNGVVGCGVPYGSINRNDVYPVMGIDRSDHTPTVAIPGLVVQFNQAGILHTFLSDDNRKDIVSTPHLVAFRNNNNNISMPQYMISVSPKISTDSLRKIGSLSDTEDHRSVLRGNIIANSYGTIVTERQHRL